VHASECEVMYVRVSVCVCVYVCVSMWSCVFSPCVWRGGGDARESV